MIKYAKTAALLGLAILTTLALAADGVVLKRTPKKDDSFKYKLSGVFDAGGGTATVTADVVEKVLEVKDNGDYIIQRTQSNLTIDLGGQTIPGENGPARVSVYHADGSLVELRGEELQPGSYRLEVLNALRFSPTAVKVGDSWKFDVPADTKTGVVKATANYTLVGDEKVGAYDTWKVKATVKEAEGDTPASSDGFFWVNKTDGTIVKVEANWTNAPISGAPMPISGKYTLNIQP